MITAQDIREKLFDKVRMGGYKEEAVDDFLEELANDVTAYQKENAVLKSKMKVLVDKIEEYRANEEALNLALLSAQKLAVQIEADARTRAAAMIAEAEKQVQATVGGIQEKADEEQKRLDSAKSATGSFLANVRAFCEAQYQNIEAAALGLEVKLPTQEAEDDVRTAARIPAEPDLDIDLSSAVETAPVRRRRQDSSQSFSL